MSDKKITKMLDCSARCSESGFHCPAFGVMNTLVKGIVEGSELPCKFCVHDGEDEICNKCSVVFVDASECLFQAREE